MFQQPLDFRDESEALFELIGVLSDDELCRQTQFKLWTINDIITHLHICLLYTSPSPRDS